MRMVRKRMDAMIWNYNCNAPRSNRSSHQQRIMIRGMVVDDGGCRIAVVEGGEEGGNIIIAAMDRPANERYRHGRRGEQNEAPQPGPSTAII